MKSTGIYSAELERARALLAGAERIVVGVGSGLSAAGGLDYGAPGPAARWFPEYGAGSLAEIQGRFWWYDRCRAEEYWGYWARHILYIRYETPVLAPYRALARLLEGRDYFIVTTNADGQLGKAGFPREKIFAPQGDYCWFQCKTPCCGELVYNEDLIRAMVDNMPSPTGIRTRDIPRCPRCGAPLVPNLRIDGSFVEAPHFHNAGDYGAFLREAEEGRTVLLELGVGYNTPGVIRRPFERWALAHPGAALIRVNRDWPGLPEALGSRGLGLGMDLGRALEALGA